MKLLFYSVLVSLFSLTVISCSNSKEKKEDILVGNLPVIVDESVLPIVLEQIEVFESSYKDAKLKTIAAPEITAVNSLIKGDANIAILTRELTENENKSFAQRSVTPRIYKVAYDGVVLIGNNESTDSTVTEAEIMGLLTGNKTRNFSLVFEDLNSSTLRYFMNKGAQDKVVGTFVETKDSLNSLIDYIVSTPNKIGVISYNQYLSLQSSFNEIDKIRILSVLNENLPEKRYVKPSQASLSTDEYPFKREIYILNYQPNMGLGIGFSSFVTGDRGQRIVLKSGLLPETMPGREIMVRDKINK